MATRNNMTVFVNNDSTFRGKAVAHENVAAYTIGERNGVLTIHFMDNSRTVYSPNVWREFDWSTEEV